MAQLTNTSVNGDLIVTGDIHNSSIDNQISIATLYQKAQSTLMFNNATWDGTYFKWTGRAMCIPVDKKIATQGYIEFNMPTSGTIVGLGGASNIVPTASGIPLPAYYMLIARHTIGGANNAFTYYVVYYASASFKDILQPNDIIIASRSETNIIKLGNGDTLTPTNSIVAGKLVDNSPVQAIVNQQNTSQGLKMWYGTLAQYNAIATKDVNTMYSII